VIAESIHDGVTFCLNSRPKVFEVEFIAAFLNSSDKQKNSFEGRKKRVLAIKSLSTGKKIVYSISGRGINQIINSEVTLTEEARNIALIFRAIYSMEVHLHDKSRSHRKDGCSSRHLKGSCRKGA
jgi:hypothetical protein